MRLIKGDCLEVMDRLIEEGIKVDAIICDLPYGTTACSWDAIISFSELWDRYLKLIKSSGNIVLFGSQPFTTKLINSNIDWFSYSMVWEKEQGTNFLLANKMPLKIHEDICVFRKPDSYGVEEFVDLRMIFRNILNDIGLKKSDVVKKLGQGLDHCFRFNSSQWGLPTKENYNKLIKEYYIQNIPEYEYLKQEYNKEFFRIYNPQKTKGTPYVSGKGNSGNVTGNVEKVQTKNEGTRNPTSILKFNREVGFHPTQKPVLLLEYLVKTYTNENGLVLDNCMGSGSTGVACVNTNRKFIGIELDDTYFEIAEKRIGEAKIIVK